ncbi:MAG: twitching motility protein PilT [Deltaproteobacteria bacterium]
MSGLTYDAGALLAAEANRRDLWALHARALQRGWLPVVPAGVLAQSWRGGPQASLSRLLRGCRVEDLTEQRARAAGVACERSNTSDIVDASVAVGALERHDLVVTSDPDDLQRIALGLGRRIQIHRL